MTMSALSDELAQVRTKKKEFLAQIERIVPWKEWLTLIQPCYYKGERGNKPYPLETMLRLYLLQNLYDLSDEARNEYEACLRSYSDQFIEHYIKTDNLEMIVKFGSLDMINREMINDYIITAKITGSNNVLLYLVSYRYKKITNPKHE